MSAAEEKQDNKPIPSRIVPSISSESYILDERFRKKCSKDEMSFDLHGIYGDSSFKYKMAAIFSTIPNKIRVHPCIIVTDNTKFWPNFDSDSEFDSEFESESKCNMVLIRLCFKSTEGKIYVYKSFEQEISVQIGHASRSSPKLVIEYINNKESMDNPESSYIILVMVKTETVIQNDVESTTRVLFYIHIDYDQDESFRFPVIRSIGKPDEEGNLHLPNGY